MNKDEGVEFIKNFVEGNEGTIFDCAEDIKETMKKYNFFISYLAIVYIKDSMEEFIIEETKKRQENE